MPHFFFGQDAVPNAVFKEGLKQHSWHFNAVCVDAVVNFNEILEAIGEPHVFKLQVEREAFKLFVQRSEVGLRTVEVFANEFSEVAEVAVGLQAVLPIDVILDGIERIEDEVPVHA